VVDFAWGTSFQAIGVLMPIRDRTEPTIHYWAHTQATAWPDAEAAAAAPDAEAAAAA
jgi:hypothetical protein